MPSPGQVGHSQDKVGGATWLEPNMREAGLKGSSRWGLGLSEECGVPWV